MKRWFQGLCNLVLVGCLVYFGISWTSSPSAANLDEIVYKHPLGNGNSLYGARDNRGGATVGFSYRYYISKQTDTDEQALALLNEKPPFLITKDPEVSAKVVDGALHLSIRGRVYDFSNYTLNSIKDSGDIKVIIGL